MTTIKFRCLRCRENYEIDEKDVEFGILYIGLRRQHFLRAIAECELCGTRMSRVLLGGVKGKLLKKLRAEIAKRKQMKKENEINETIDKVEEDEELSEDDEEPFWSKLENDNEIDIDDEDDIEDDDEDEEIDEESLKGLR